MWIWESFKTLNQFFRMYVTEIDRHRDFACFLFEFLSSEAVLTSEIYVRASVDVLRAQSKNFFKNGVKLHDRIFAYVHQESF